ncbi:hypothetical protein Dimus_020781 [Dionaea muscipula]
MLGEVLIAVVAPDVVHLPARDIECHSPASLSSCDNSLVDEGAAKRLVLTVNHQRVVGVAYYGGWFCLCVPVIGDAQPQSEAFDADLCKKSKRNCVGQGGDGMVSEEGRVSPGARGALRPQLADGLRQSLSSPMEPVMGSEGGGGQ